MLLCSTPRSGNTYVRRLLAQAWRLKEYAEHHPSAVRWSELGSRAIVQMHWHRTAGLLSILDPLEFKPICVIRHPIAVLISILHFSRYSRATSRWLDGEEGDEAVLINCSPASEAFADYACGRRAGALLRVSAEWVSAGTPFLRYEDLVVDPVRSLDEFAERAGQRRDVTWGDAVAANSLDKLRPTSRNHHFWQGQASLWTGLVSRDIAAKIMAAHREVFDTLGYSIDESRSLSRSEIEQNWSSVKARETVAS